MIRLPPRSTRTDTLFPYTTLFRSLDLLPLLGLAGLDTIGNNYRQRTDAYAAFVHGEWTVAPMLTLVGGLRYTKERKISDQATNFLCVIGRASWRDSVSTDV